jgi:hypothetical protein
VSVLLEELADGGDVDDVALDALRDRLFQRTGAVFVEQAQELGHRGPEVVAALADAEQEGAASR